MPRRGAAAALWCLPQLANPTASGVRPSSTAAFAFAQVILAEHKPNPHPHPHPNPHPNQVILAEHKPAWDDALRVVVDVGFDSMASLSDVSEVAPKQLPT